MLQPHPLSGSAFAGLHIGLLGGSFNPAHAAHLAMSAYALKRLGLDQVWWLVSPQNPLKSNKDMAILVTRIKKAYGVARHPKIIVTDLESQFGTRYTIDTLRVLRKHFPRTRFVWLMGADNLKQIPRWHKWPLVFRSMPVAVFRRPGYAAGRGVGKAAQRFDGAWLSAQRSRHLAQYPAPAWLVLDNPLNTLSATAIRGHRRGKNKKGD